MGVSGHPELNGDVGFCVRTLELISRRRNLFYGNRDVENVKNHWRRTIFDVRFGFGVPFYIYFDINIVIIGHGSAEQTLITIILENVFFSLSASNCV